MQQQDEEHPINAKGWMDAYPAPTIREDYPLAFISPEEIGSEMDKGSTPGKDFIIVDVRRSDCTSMICGAVNLPAQSLYVALPTLLTLLKHIPIVIFHCNQSTGRGPRAAGWYADALQKHLHLSDADVSKRVRILQGGIVAWQARFGQGSIQQRGRSNGKCTVQL